MADSKPDHVLEWFIGLVAIMFGMLQAGFAWVFNREVKRIDRLEIDARQTRHNIRNEFAVADAELEERIDSLEKQQARLEERIPKHK